MKFRPSKNSILVEKVEKVSKTTGGILLPDNHNDRVAHALVVAIGAGNVSVTGVEFPLEYKVGEKIAYINGTGTDIKVDNKGYILLKEVEILGAFA